MASASSSNATLRVGDWQVDPALHEISAAGKTLKLEPKAMAVLCYLAERPGQVVSREALLSAVWPGVVVGDDSLTQAVIKLRKALGDTAELPAYIQTIPKGGYRLVAPVGPPEKAAPAAAGLATEPLPARPKPHRRWHAPATAAAVVLASAAVWWLNSDVPGGTSTRPTAIAEWEATRVAQPTIAIMPFEALGDDPQAVLVARGITADLATDLSKVFGLSVISGTPADAAAGTDTRSRVSIRYFVSGSVQRVDDRLRLHIRLLDAATGRQLWSERFERPLSSLFAMQEEIVPNILQILPARVSDAELRRIAHRHTRNLEAYEYFQRGQAALLVRQQEQNEEARNMFRRAIALDASFALAYAALAQTYAADHRNQWTADRAAAVERALQLARTAHEIDPDVRETYWVLAMVHLERGQHSRALDYLETAVRLYPSYADAYALMGGINAYMGRATNTLPLLRTAMRLNPDGGYLYSLILGRAYFALGDLEQARINLQHALARNPVNLEAHVYMAAALVAADNMGDAAWEAEEIRALQPSFARNAWLATHPLTDGKTRAKLLEALRRIGL